MSALYQLKVSKPVFVGKVVTINGPLDKYGTVMKLNDNGFHLIRGTGSRKMPVVRKGAAG